MAPYEGVVLQMLILTVLSGTALVFSVSCCPPVTAGRQGMILFRSIGSVTSPEQCHAAALSICEICVFGHVIMRTHGETLW